MSKSGRALRNFYVFVDLAILNISFFGSAYFFNQDHNYLALDLTILAGLILLWLVIGYSLKLYTLNLHNGFSPRMRSVAKCNLTFVALVLSFIFISIHFSLPISDFFLVFVAIFFVFDVVVNLILIKVISRQRRKRENVKYTLVAGSGDLAREISNYFSSNPDYGYKIEGYLSCNGEKCKVNKKKVVGTLDEMNHYLNHHSIDEVVIALPSYESSQRRIKHIIQEADYQGVRVSWVPDYRGLFGKYYESVHYGHLDFVNVHSFPLDGISAAIAKEIFDYIFSIVVLLLLSPLFLAISIMIKIDSSGPVFYCPVRVGKGGKNFKVYKFRTMSVNDAVDGGKLSTQKDDPRITRFGRILRKYSLDELPQFINVYNGTMSVVGPRPHRNFLDQQMKEHVDKYMLRRYFKPGITGWAQVNGWRGPTTSEEQINQRTVHDLWYIKKWSFLLDLKIILLTVFSKKAHKNAF